MTAALVHSLETHYSNQKIMQLHILHSDFLHKTKINKTKSMHHASRHLSDVQEKFSNTLLSNHIQRGGSDITKGGNRQCGSRISGSICGGSKDIG
jgi:hypothetical protein